jgi:hypothetical protein
MSDAINEVSKFGDCIGQWSKDAEECDRCLFIKTCRAKTQDNAEFFEIAKSPAEQFISEMGDHCYMVERRKGEKTEQVTFSRNGVAIYIEIWNTGSVRGKVWGKIIDLGPMDVNRIEEYIKTLVMKADAGENAD